MMRHQKDITHWKSITLYDNNPEKTLKMRQWFEPTKTPPIHSPRFQPWVKNRETECNRFNGLNRTPLEFEQKYNHSQNATMMRHSNHITHWKSIELCDNNPEKTLKMRQCLPCWIDVGSQQLKPHQSIAHGFNRGTRITKWVQPFQRFKSHPSGIWTKI